MSRAAAYKVRCRLVCLTLLSRRFSYTLHPWRINNPLNYLKFLVLYAILLTGVPSSLNEFCWRHGRRLNVPVEFQ